MSDSTTMLMKVRARPNFGSVIARAGLMRGELAKAAGISTRTLDALARPAGYGREGYTREVYAWKISHAFGRLTNQTAEAAFARLFEEVVSDGEAQA